MSDIPEGYGLIAPRGQESAIAALQAAEDAGVDPTEVRTVDDGYLVPEKVLAAYEAAQKKSKKSDDDPEPAKKTPAKKPTATKN